jgi:hypothetical protein
MTARFRSRASRPVLRTGTRAPVWAACLLAAVAVGFAAVHLLRSGSGQQAATAGPEARQAAAQPELAAPSVVEESPIQLVRGRPPPAEMKPLFDPNMRLNLGEAATLKFALQDAQSRAAAAGKEVTASVFHGRDPARRLPVHDEGDGVYDVPFQPYGPGRFQVVVNVGGVPAATQQIGVIGATGRADATVDIVDPLSVDPRDFRARTGGKQRRR